MNIDEMPAGREMDALVAERVMGWTRVHQMDSTGDLCGVPPQGAPPYVLLHYSTDIAAVFQVVDELLDGTRVFMLESWMPKKAGWQAMFKGKLNWEAAQYEQLVYAYAETRPLAICRAALKLMEHKEEVAEVDCQHEFFKCQVPAGDSCVAIYYQVCRKCRWDKRKGIYMPLDIWRGWALPQLEELDEENK